MTTHEVPPAAMAKSTMPIQNSLPRPFFFAFCTFAMGWAPSGSLTAGEAAFAGAGAGLSAAFAMLMSLCLFEPIMQVEYAIDDRNRARKYSLLVP
jgi:hypothetical protein